MCGTGFRDLHREMSDTSGGTVDQHATVLVDATRINEGLPGGEPGQREGSGLVIEALWFRYEYAGRSDGVLGVGAVAVREGQHAEHRVAGLIDGHARAHSRHVA